MEENNEDITIERIAAAATQMMKDVTTIRETKGITSAEMEAMYSLGFNFYRTGRLDEAEKVFKFLCIYDHLNPKYWIGLGACHQVNKNYEAAITAYGYGSFLDLDNPKPMFYAAECQLAMGDKDGALATLEGLAHFCGENTAASDFLKKAEELKAKIKGNAA